MKDIGRPNGTKRAHAKITLDPEAIARFCREWKVTEFALFGSVLRDDYGPNSDVDVLLSFSPDAPWSLLDLVKMQFQLEEMFGRKVDLVEEAGVRNPFRRQAILRTKQVVYAA